MGGPCPRKDNVKQSSYIRGKTILKTLKITTNITHKNNIMYETLTHKDTPRLQAYVILLRIATKGYVCYKFRNVVLYVNVSLNSKALYS